MRTTEGGARRDRLLGWAALVYGVGGLITFWAFLSDVVFEDGDYLRSAPLLIMATLALASRLSAGVGFAIAGVGLLRGTEKRDKYLCRGAWVAAGGGMVWLAGLVLSWFSSDPVFRVGRWSLVSFVLALAATVISAVVFGLIAAAFGSASSRGTAWRTRSTYLGAAAACLAVVSVLELAGSGGGGFPWDPSSLQSTMSALGKVLSVGAAAAAAYGFWTAAGPREPLGQVGWRRRDRCLVLAGAMLAAAGLLGLLESVSWWYRIAMWTQDEPLLGTIEAFVPELRGLVAALLGAVAFWRYSPRPTIPERSGEVSCTDAADRI